MGILNDGSSYTRRSTDGSKSIVPSGSNRDDKEEHEIDDNQATANRYKSEQTIQETGETATASGFKETQKTTDSKRSVRWKRYFRKTEKRSLRLRDFIRLPNAFVEN